MIPLTYPQSREITSIKLKKWHVLDKISPDSLHVYVNKYNTSHSENARPNFRHFIIVAVAFHYFQNSLPAKQ